jgi:hypothetical protein
MSTTPDNTPDPTPTEPTQEPAAATPEPPKPTEPPKSSPWDNPEAAKAEIERLRRENASERTNAKAKAAEEARNALAQEFGKILGFVKDEPIDPAELTEQLTATQKQARQAALELAIFKSTPDAAAAAALLDSRSFLAKVADVDPTDTASIAAAVTEAITANPALGKRLPAPNPAQGSSADGPATAGQLTRQDVERLARDGRHAEIDKAREEGRLNSLLGIQ